MLETTPIIELTIPAALQTVWAAFREAETVREWHGWEHPDLDAEIQLIYFDATTTDQQAQTLHIGGHMFAFLDRGEAGTLIRITRSDRALRAGLDGEEFEAARDEIEAGWLSFVQQLRFHLTHHQGHARRTLHLTGQARATVPLPVTELLTFAPQPSAGGPQLYKALGAGTELSGEVWFHTPAQVGVKVNDWGPGLLLLAYTPNGAVRFGALSATLTTYGLTDDAFTALEDEWISWWARHYQQS